MSYVLYAITHTDITNADERGRALLLEWEGKGGSKGPALERPHIEALMQVLKRYPGQKDVVRACLRCLVNLSRCSSVMSLIQQLNGFEPILQCIVKTSSARDCITCAVLLLKELLVFRRIQQQQDDEKGVGSCCTPSSMFVIGGTAEVLPGLLLCLSAKLQESHIACFAYNTAASSAGNPMSVDLERKCFNGAIKWGSYLASSSKIKEEMEDDDLLALQACLNFLRPLLARRRVSSSVDTAGLKRGERWEQQVSKKSVWPL